MKTLSSEDKRSGEEEKQRVREGRRRLAASPFNHDIFVREYESQEHGRRLGPNGPISGQLRMSRNAIVMSQGVLIVIQNMT
jgi:hypothetical protein